tara:strand:+ start:108651 stop:110306 length:1656 start_codon:yes stop_codon:yes gene_type:complete
MSGTLGYAPPTFAGAIRLDLSKNEGRAPDERTLLDAVPTAAELARYPTLRELQRELAANYRVLPERVLVTAGADDALLRLCLFALRPSRQQPRAKKALVASPTFEMIPRYVELAGGELVTVPWPEGAFPTDALLAAADDATALVFVVSPNNPTGAIATVADLERIADALPDAWIVLDAAYAEFASEDLTECALRLANVVVVRTLSKAWGLAGLRVGCAIAAPERLAQLHAAGNPMPVSVASATLAIARLQTGRADVADHVAQVRDQRIDLVRILRSFGAKPVEPCQGNFVLVHGVKAKWLTQSLAALGIAVRRFPGQPELADAVRIGLPAEPKAYGELVLALTTVFAPQALLFDMDGVLADVSESYRVAIVKTAESFGVELSAGDIAAAKRRGNANDDWQLTCSLLQERGVSCSLSEVTERFESFYLTLRSRERLLVAAERLRDWGQRFQLAVVTGRPRAQAEFFLAQFAIRDLFGAVVCREDAALKPDPEPVRLAMQQLGVQSAWMLGDTVDDLLSARAAGVLPIAVGAEAPAANAACVLANPEDLEELL